VSKRIFRPTWPLKRAVVRLGAGVGLAWRRFLLDAEVTAMNFESGLHSQLFVEGEAYPLHLVTSSALAQIGLRVSYTHSAGLSTEQDDVDAESLSTSMGRLWAGLVYRVPRFREPRLPRLDLRVGLVHATFEVAENPNVQDLSLTAFAAGGTMTVLFKPWLGFELGGEYRTLLRARSPFLEPYETKPAGLQGFNVVGGLLGKVVGGLGYRGTVVAERFVGDLPALETDGVLKVRDWYVCGNLALTYEL